MVDKMTLVIAALTLGISVLTAMRGQWRRLFRCGKGCVRFACGKWRGSGIVWMIFKWDEYVATIHAPHQSLLKLCGPIDDGVVYRHVIKPCADLPKARRRARRSAILWACNPNWGMRHVETRSTRLPLYMEGMVIFRVNGERTCPAIELPNDKGAYPGRKVIDPLDWGRL